MSVIGSAWLHGLQPVHARDRYPEVSHQGHVLAIQPSGIDLTPARIEDWCAWNATLGTTDHAFWRPGVDMLFPYAVRLDIPRPNEDVQFP